MCAKVGVDRQREAEQAEEEKKTLGAIIPGSVLAAAVLFLFIYLFFSQTLSIWLSVACARLQYRLADCLRHQISTFQ